MKKPSTWIAVTALSVLCSCSETSAPADLILYNANIYTLDDEQARAEALAIREDRFVFAGSSDDARDYEGPSTKTLDLGGVTVLPGLADSHVHLDSIGSWQQILDLRGAQSLEDLLSRLKEKVEQSRPGEWITGRGWNEAQWNPPQFPTRRDLDQVAPKNPVWLRRIDSHGGVANSLALRIAGINKATKDPPGGEILRDPATREPTGMLLDRATRIIGRFLPEQTPDQKREALILGARRMATMGWTEVGIAGNPWDEVEMIRELYRAGEISIRIYDAVDAPGEGANHLLEQGYTLRAFDGLFTLRGMKLAVDGALGSKGAALFEKYNDHDSRGLLLWDADELLPLLQRALREGIQIQTHAIGDRANRFVLDIYERAFAAVPAAERRIAEPRWRVEHAQIVHPDDIPRFAELNVIPSMQPSHAITDLHFAKSRLGVERLQGAYAWRSFIDSGSIIAGGSDAPVERGDPTVEFYAAVVRKDLNGYSEDYWHPEQTVSREEALKMFTIWAAYATFEEDVRGSIEPGKWADLTVLSKDIMTVPEAEIPSAECLMTIVGGEIVYDRQVAAR